MNRFKKALALSLATISVASFAACDFGSLQSQYGGEGDANATLELIINENATTTIEFAYLAAGFGEDPYIAVANAYMKKNPNVQITTYSNPEINGALNTIMIPNSSEGLSDIYSIRDEGALKTWAKQGLVESLDGIMASQTQDGRTMAASMTEAAASAIKFGDSVYAVPEYSNVTGFVYNASLFKEYGWEIPNTTKDLEELCKKIVADTNGEVDPIIWCKDADGYLYFGAENWISQHAGIENMEQFYAMEDKTVYQQGENSLYNSKKLALENLQKFFTPGEWCYTKSRTEYFMDAQRKIMKGECAMMLNGSWFENEMHIEFNDPNYADVEIGMFPVPQLSDAAGNVLHAEGYTTVENKRVLTSSFGAYYFIPANAPNKETAKDFLLFLSSEEACEEYTKYSNAVRPFTYNYSTSSAVYSEVSTFGKSVLKMASENYLYAPVFNSVLGVIGKGRLWALDYRPESMLVAQNPETVSALLAMEAAQADTKWDDWMTEATK